MDGSPVWRVPIDSLIRPSVYERRLFRRRKPCVGYREAAVRSRSNHLTCANGLPPSGPVRQDVSLGQRGTQLVDRLEARCRPEVDFIAGLWREPEQIDSPPAVDRPHESRPDQKRRDDCRHDNGHEYGWRQDPQLMRHIRHDDAGHADPAGACPRLTSVRPGRGSGRSSTDVLAARLSTPPVNRKRRRNRQREEPVVGCRGLPRPAASAGPRSTPRSAGSASLCWRNRPARSPNST